MALLRPYTEFPFELMDEVIDHLRDDQRALAACSLVCKSWVRRTYYHLFETFSLSPEKSRRLVALGATNNILPHVRMMIIIGDLHQAKMPQALSLLRANSAPRILILDSVNLRTDVFKTIKSLPMSAVDTLRLTRCLLNQFTAIWHVVAVLPGLDRLEMHHAELAPLYTVPSESVLPVSPRLSTIEIASHNVAPYLDLLELVASQFTLKTLNFGVLCIEDAQKAKDVVAAFPSLQDFTATVAFLPKILPSIGIPALTNLRSLYLILLPADLTLICTFITDLLWNLPSSHMESVAVKFFPVLNTSEASVHKPSQQPPALPHLKTIRVAFNYDTIVNYGWVEEMLRRCFLIYHERGILEIDLGLWGNGQVATG